MSSSSIGFADEMAARTPPPFTLPLEFRTLFDWIDGNGWIDIHPDGWSEPNQRYATLHDPAAKLGSGVVFRIWGTVGGIHIAAPWLGNERPNTADRLLPFARIGADGTEAAFWIDETGNQRIVILGSGSGSILACVLADEPIDFLRLLGIGYYDVCWADEWTRPPVEEPGWPVLNEPYRHWLMKTFDVTIPATASEIVSRPAEHGDVDSDDDFINWLNSLRDDR